MTTRETRVRKRVSLPAPIAKRLEAHEQERKRLFELADRLTRSKNSGEQQRLKDELARLVFGT